MKLTKKLTTIIILFGIITIVIFIYWLLKIISLRYRQEIEYIESQPEINKIHHVEKEKVTKIRINKSNEAECVEMSPDGIVRIYKVCGEVLDNAVRQEDVRYISRLFKQVSETDFQYLVNFEICSGYMLYIYQGSSVKKVCLDMNNGFSTEIGGATNESYNRVIVNIINDIIQTIDLIYDTIPSPTSQTTPVLSLTPTNEPSPTQTDPYSSPTPIFDISPTPTPVGYERPPFSCDFVSQSGNKRPYMISEVVCSSEPTPMP